jgi:hypothetical protein
MFIFACRYLFNNCQVHALELAAVRQQQEFSERQLQAITQERIQLQAELKNRDLQLLHQQQQTVRPNSLSPEVQAAREEAVAELRSQRSALQVELQRLRVSEQEAQHQLALLKVQHESVLKQLDGQDRIAKQAVDAVIHVSCRSAHNI